MLASALTLTEWLPHKQGHPGTCTALESVPPLMPVAPSRQTVLPTKVEGRSEDALNALSLSRPASDPPLAPIDTSVASPHRSKITHPVPRLVAEVVLVQRKRTQARPRVPSSNLSTLQSMSGSVCIRPYPRCWLWSLIALGTERSSSRRRDRCAGLGPITSQSNECCHRARLRRPIHISCSSRTNLL